MHELLQPEVEAGVDGGAHTGKVCVCVCVSVSIGTKDHVQRRQVSVEDSWDLDSVSDQNRCMDGWADGWMDRWVDGWMDRPMDGWTDRRIDGWMD